MWFNYWDEEKNEQKVEYLSAEKKKRNMVDFNFFWLGNLAFGGMWAFFTFINIITLSFLKIHYIVLDIICTTMVWTNLYNFYKCKGSKLFYMYLGH